MSLTFIGKGVDASSLFLPKIKTLASIIWTHLAQKRTHSQDMIPYLSTIFVLRHLKMRCNRALSLSLFLGYTLPHSHSIQVWREESGRYHGKEGAPGSSILSSKIIASPHWNHQMSLKQPIIKVIFVRAELELRLVVDYSDKGLTCQCLAVRLCYA